MMDQVQVLGSLSKGKTLDAFAEFPSDVQGQFPTKRKDELGFPHHETIAFDITFIWRLLTQC
jgi:hypothetical protein